MTNDPTLPNSDADATHQWLDGLTGQTGSGAAHREGARVRDALVPDHRDAVNASWRDIEARAGATVDASRQTLSTAPAAVGRPAGAANAPAWWRKFGWAAALMLGVAIGALMLQTAPTPDAALRGIGDPGSQGAQWLVERPKEAAESLAAELRGLQADVALTADGDTVILHIQAPPERVKAVNARLAALETGLDAEGKLQLSLRPIR